MWPAERGHSTSLALRSEADTRTSIRARARDGSGRAKREDTKGKRSGCSQNVHTGAKGTGHATPTDWGAVLPMRRSNHDPKDCRHRESVCHFCNKKGHMILSLPHAEADNRKTARNLPRKHFGENASHHSKPAMLLPTMGNRRLNYRFSWLVILRQTPYTRTSS